MNEGLMQIKTRRSVRKYKPDMVPKEILDQILEAGTYAPTAMNRQSPILIAVTNKEVRDRLSKLNSSIMGTDSDPFYGAPVVVIVLADKSVGTRVYDGSLVMGNLMLAYAWGQQLLDPPRERGIRAAGGKGNLKIPGHRRRI